MTTRLARAMSPSWRGSNRDVMRRRLSTAANVRWRKGFTRRDSALSLRKSERVARLHRDAGERLQQVQQRAQRPVAVGHLGHVIEEPRQVLAVVRLAVAVFQAAEDAQD